MSSTSKSILPVPVPIHRSSLPISPYSPDPLSVPISPSSTKPNPPSITGSTFVNIFKTAIKTYESRSRVNLPMYLGDSYTPDKFRGLIQAQALNLRKQYSRRHSSLFNRLVNSLFFFLYFNAYFYAPVAKIGFFAVGIIFDVRISFAFSNVLLVMSGLPLDTLDVLHASRRATVFTSLWTFLNTLKASSSDSNCIPRSPLPLK